MHWSILAFYRCQYYKFLNTGKKDIDRGVGDLTNKNEFVYRLYHKVLPPQLLYRLGNFFVSICRPHTRGTPPLTSCWNCIQTGSPLLSCSLRYHGNQPLWCHLRWYSGPDCTSVIISLTITLLSQSLYSKFR